VTGIQNAVDPADSWIALHGCHNVALARGESISSILGELFGTEYRYSKFKGGSSMLMNNKEKRFFGSRGAQVPVGTGLAFANKYKSESGKPMNVAIACYADYVANQGQIWEAANMANLWKLVRF